VDAGNTVIVIEHNLEVIKSADHVIDLGPEAGEGGGRVVAVGTPEQVAGCAESHTGLFLRPLLPGWPRRDGTPGPTPTLLEWRREFPILSTTTYLVSHSLGAMPRGAAARLQEYADTWATRGVRAWAEGWWRMPLTVGDEVAQVIGAAPGSVVMHQNVSICQALILSCFDLAGAATRSSTRT
jgi:hypothetical protein